MYFVTIGLTRFKITSYITYCPCDDTADRGTGNKIIRDRMETSYGNSEGKLLPMLVNRVGKRTRCGKGWGILLRNQWGRVIVDRDVILFSVIKVGI